VSDDDEQARFDAAIRQLDEELVHQRESAAARGEEYAVPYELGVKYDAGAPEVELYCNGLDAFLAFYTNEDFREIGLVQFAHCYRLYLGPPGSDTPNFNEHRLYGKGLDRWSPHRVINSTWISPGQHYLFAFHDEMVEAAADYLVVSKWEIPMRGSASLRARSRTPKLEGRRVSLQASLPRTGPGQRRDA
jgi:hypothetical protein